MTFFALALVLIGALAHASWNLVLKKTGGDDRLSFFSTVFASVLWAPLALWLGWHIVPTWGLKEWLIILGCSLVKWIYFLTLMTGYRRADLTVVYPTARGSGPLLSSAIAVVVFGEALSKNGALGIVAVCLGVFLIAGGPRIFSGLTTAADRARVRDGVLWGVMTGALIGCYTICDAYAVKVAALSPILLDYWTNVVRLPFALVPAMRDVPELKRLWRAQWRAALTIATLAPAGYVCILYAMKIAPVSHVAPAREVSMLFAAILGGQLLQEKDRGYRIVGALFVTCGVVVLAWPH